MSDYCCNNIHIPSAYPVYGLSGHMGGHSVSAQDQSHPAHGFAQPQAHISCISNSPGLTSIPSTVNKCRFCGEELPLDPLTIVSHFNSHYRQGCQDSNPCYGSQMALDSRLIFPMNSFFVHNHNIDTSSPQLSTAIAHNPYVNGNMIGYPHNNGAGFNTYPHVIAPGLLCGRNDNGCQNEEQPNTLTNNPVVCHEHASNDLVAKNVSHNRSVLCNSGNDSLGLESTSIDRNLPTSHRCSPLNLTGRPKLESSPMPALVNSSPNLNPMDQPTCSATHGVPNVHLAHQNDLSHSQFSHGFVGSSISTTFTNAYNPYNSYFGPSCQYSGISHQLSPQLPSCKHQSYSQSPDDSNLSAPVLPTPVSTLGQQEQETEILAESSRQLSPNSVPDPVLPPPESCSEQLEACTNPTIGSSTITQPSSLQSTDCYMTNQTDEELNDKREQFQCANCQSIFNDRGLYRNHVLSHESSDSNCETACDTVNKLDSSEEVNVLNNESTVINVALTHSTDNRSKKNLCVATVPDVASISHEKRHGSEHFPSLASGQHGHLSMPMASPASSKPYKCSTCNLEFEIKEDLREHLGSHDAAKPFHCDSCGLGLSNQRALKRHKLTHTGHKPHKCTTCGKAFLQKHDLTRHLSVHERPKFMNCEQCKRTFTSPSSLKTHKCKNGKDNMPFICSTCGDGCSNRITWSYHMWKHTKDSKFMPFQENISQVEPVIL